MKPVLPRPPGYRDPNHPVKSARRPLPPKTLVPPSFQPRKRRSRHWCRLCLCCLILLLITVILLMIISGGLFYIWFDPKLQRETKKLIWDWRACRSSHRKKGMRRVWKPWLMWTMSWLRIELDPRFFISSRARNWRWRWMWKQELELGLRGWRQGCWGRKFFAEV